MWQWWEGSKWVASVVMVGWTLDDNVGEDDEIYARESSPQPGRRLRGHKVTYRRETGRKEGEKWEGRQMDRRKGEWGNSSDGVGKQGDDS